MSVYLPRLWQATKVNKCCPTAKYYLAGASGLSFAYALYAKITKSHVQSDIEARKLQLSKPIYELRDSEAVSPPWNASNLKEWLYRPVRITGRPLHYLGMYIPREEYAKHGFEYVVPLVTKENEDQSVQEGMLVSLGFIPYEYQEIPNRFRLEDAGWQTFTCFVSQLPELQDNSKGNVDHRRRSEWNYADLELMAKFTNFKNADKIGKVVLESVQLDSPVDERNMRLYNLDADHIQDYPYQKSRSGALYHKNNMPWDWQRNQNRSLASGVLFGSLGVLLHLIK